MSNIWSKEETLWSFALYGTAVGAGTLFLPIQLGSAGAVVLFITALVAWPLTYCHIKPYASSSSHRKHQQVKG